MNDAAAEEPTIEVVRPGLLTTMQDLGRPGRARFGVSPAGAMDPLALRVANLLVGNPQGAAALELTGPGAALLFLRPSWFAIAGADLGAALDGAPCPLGSAVLAPAGARLAFERRVRGGRAALAVAGGFVVPLVLGSRATDLGARIGGPGGAPLARGTMLAVDAAVGARPSVAAAAGQRRAQAVVRALAALAAAYEDPGLLHFVPEDDADVPPAAVAAFTAGARAVSPRSNRTGYRLAGPALPTGANPARLSEPTAPGAIQLPPDGEPILLMADRNTTGGYPRLGHLASASRPKAAQLLPGDPVRFVPITREEAVRRLRVQEDAVTALARALGEHRA